MASPIHLHFPSPIEVQDQAVIEGGEHHYLAHVHRARPGDTVALFGYGTQERLAVIESIERERSWVRLVSAEESHTEPRLHISLGIAVGKGRKLEEIVETTTVLGVRRIIPFVAERSVAKRSNLDLTQRLQKIAIEACRQCRRVWVPEIHEVTQGLTAAFEDITEQNCQVFFLDEAGGTDLVKTAMKVSPYQPAALFIGPEGGWSDSERGLLYKSGALPTSLGPRILRTELAPIVAVSLLERITTSRSEDCSQL